MYKPNVYMNDKKKSWQCDDPLNKVSQDKIMFCYHFCPKLFNSYRGAASKKRPNGFRPTSQLFA